ncbi:MAG: hypothetical protein OIF57_06730 [Marinobacterium sp.]|nr:hypothetical protein [Marinobacterium sp.]
MSKTKIVVTNPTGHSFSLTSRAGNCKVPAGCKDHEMLVSPDQLESIRDLAKSRPFITLITLSDESSGEDAKPEKKTPSSGSSRKTTGKAADKTTDGGGQ